MNFPPPAVEPTSVRERLSALSPAEFTRDRVVRELQQMMPATLESVTTLAAIAPVVTAVVDALQTVPQVEDTSTSSVVVQSDSCEVAFAASPTSRVAAVEHVRDLLMTSCARMSTRVAEDLCAHSNPVLARTVDRLAYLGCEPAEGQQEAAVRAMLRCVPESDARRVSRCLRGCAQVGDFLRYASAATLDRYQVGGVGAYMDDLGDAFRVFTTGAVVMDRGALVRGAASRLLDATPAHKAQAFFFEHHRRILVGRVDLTLDAMVHECRLGDWEAEFPPLPRATQPRASLLEVTCDAAPRFVDFVLDTSATTTQAGEREIEDSLVSDDADVDMFVFPPLAPLGGMYPSSRGVHDADVSWVTTTEFVCSRPPGARAVEVTSLDTARLSVPFVPDPSRQSFIVRNVTSTDFVSGNDAVKLVVLATRVCENYVAAATQCRRIDACELPETAEAHGVEVERESMGNVDRALFLDRVRCRTTMPASAFALAWLLRNLLQQARHPSARAYAYLRVVLFADIRSIVLHAAWHHPAFFRAAIMLGLVTGATGDEPALELAVENPLSPDQGDPRAVSSFALAVSVFSCVINGRATVHSNGITAEDGVWLRRHDEEVDEVARSVPLPREWGVVARLRTEEDLLERGSIAARRERAWMSHAESKDPMLMLATALASVHQRRSSLSSQLMLRDALLGFGADATSRDLLANGLKDELNVFRRLVEQTSGREEAMDTACGARASALSLRDVLATEAPHSRELVLLDDDLFAVDRHLEMLRGVARADPPRKPFGATRVMHCTRQLIQRATRERATDDYAALMSLLSGMAGPVVASGTNQVVAAVCARLYASMIDTDRSVDAVYGLFIRFVRENPMLQSLVARMGACALNARVPGQVTLDKMIWEVCFSLTDPTMAYVATLGVCTMALLIPYGFNQGDGRSAPSLDLVSMVPSEQRRRAYLLFALPGAEAFDLSTPLLSRIFASRYCRTAIATAEHMWIQCAGRTLAEAEFGSVPAGVPLLPFVVAATGVRLARTTDAAMPIVAAAHMHAMQGALKAGQSSAFGDFDVYWATPDPYGAVSSAVPAALCFQSKQAMLRVLNVLSQGAEDESAPTTVREIRGRCRALLCERVENAGVETSSDDPETNAIVGAVVDATLVQLQRVRSVTYAVFPCTDERLSAAANALEAAIRALPAETFCSADPVLPSPQMVEEYGALVRSLAELHHLREAEGNISVYPENLVLMLRYVLLNEDLANRFWQTFAVVHTPLEQSGTSATLAAAQLQFSTSFALAGGDAVLEIPAALQYDEDAKTTADDAEDEAQIYLERLADAHDAADMAALMSDAQHHLDACYKSVDRAWADAAVLLSPQAPVRAFSNTVVMLVMVKAMRPFVAIDWREARDSLLAAFRRVRAGHSLSAPLLRLPTTDIREVRDGFAMELFSRSVVRRSDGGNEFSFLGSRW